MGSGWGTGSGAAIGWASPSCGARSGAASSRLVETASLATSSASVTCIRWGRGKGGGEGCKASTATSATWPTTATPRPIASPRFRPLRP
ncbi:hypothetical protein [Novosphingobium humi]|uniref:hypothetical protein n=1 Tax=Novosphingobium humi TaxID=2282397 RepID=UPI0025B20C67|nr:hypothetical protein [Novosphingobium humi]WJS99710.1 hypothetical protein NYQ05_06075 [Novosphingobium humi]